jgi:hypothetical protein
MPFPTRSPELVEQIRHAYAMGTMSTRILALMFSISKSELSALVRQHGWTARAAGLYAPGKFFRERAAEIRANEAARERELYNGSAADVRLLRQRGFVVVRAGAGFMVGNQRCTFAQLEAKAARERRLSVAANSIPVFSHPAEHQAAD